MEIDGRFRSRLEEYARAWRLWIEDPAARIEMVHAEVVVEL
jgi:hypothetical protein